MKKPHRGLSISGTACGGDANVLQTAACSESGLPGKGVDIDIYRYRERGRRVRKTIYHIDVDARYLGALQIPVIKGSAFPDIKASDVRDSTLPRNAIVTASFTRMAGWTNPLGEVLYHENQKCPVIGVIPDFHYGSLQKAIQPLVLLQQVGQPDYLLVRVARTRMAAVLERLEEHWKKAFPEMPFSYSFLDEQLIQQYRDEYNLLSLLLTLTVLMVAISCIGLVAYVSFLLRMARADIAIRRVIGAGFHHIYTLFVRQFVWLLVIAFVVATPLAWWFANVWLRQFAYHVSPRATDPVIAIVAMGALVGLIVLRFSFDFGAKTMRKFAAIALLLTATGPLQAADRPARFWNLTRHTVSELQLAPTGSTAWGPNQCKNDKDGTVDPDERLRNHQCRRRQLRCPAGGCQWPCLHRPQHRRKTGRDLFHRGKGTDVVQSLTAPIDPSGAIVMDIIDIVLRLLAATLIGGAIGLNRDLHGKPIGVRTLSLVGLGAAMAVDDGSDGGRRRSTPMATRSAG